MARQKNVFFLKLLFCLRNIKIRNILYNIKNSKKLDCKLLCSSCLVTFFQSKPLEIHNPNKEIALIFLKIHFLAKQ